MPITSIITQPDNDALRAAYRPIILRAEADNIITPKNFGMGILFGVAIIYPLLGVPVVPGDTLTISGGTTVDGDYAVDSVSTLVLSGYLVQLVNTTPNIAGVSHPNTNIAINGVLIVNNDPPPVVYCDVYFDDIYYKSLSKTHPDQINSTTSEYEFDISDACQEKLKYKVPLNGNATLFLTAFETFKKCYGKLRSSGYDGDGFVEVEGLVPIQGTGLNPPVSGEGFVSNQFYVANSTLQHEDNPDFATHLEFFKTGNWSALAWPLTHRPVVYKICPGDSDMFPMIYMGPKDPKCVKIFYKIKGTNVFLESQSCFCLPIQLTFDFSNTTQFDVPYSEEIIVAVGTPPLTLTINTLPSWLTAVLVGNVLTISGTPSVADAGHHDIDLTISNDCASESFVTYIDVEPCIAIEADTYSLPNAETNTPYLAAVNLLGSPAFNITGSSLPIWMTAEIQFISGEWHLVLSGTPDIDDEATDVSISVTVENPCGTITVTGTIDVVLDDIGGGDLTVTLTRVDANTLRANIFGGTGPYTYNFFNGATGSPCAAVFFANQTGSTAGPTEDTDYTAADYQDAEYEYWVGVTDSLGANASSNHIFETACLVPETIIRMNDGGNKTLLELMKGSILSGNNAVTGYAKRTVKQLAIINGGLLKASLSHMHILHNGKKVSTNMLNEGDMLVNEFGEPVEIKTIEIVEGRFEVINISTENHTYIANGILTHNKLLC